MKLFYVIIGFNYMMKTIKIILTSIIASACVAGILYAGSEMLGATTVFPTRGGTGTATIPSYGEVLVGTSAGLYNPQATSTLGIDTTYHIDAGSYVYPTQGDYHSAPYYTATSTTATSTFPNIDLQGLLTDNTNFLSVGNLQTAYDHSQDNTQAHSDYMLNTGDTSTGDYTFNGNVGVGITPTENFHVYNADATAFKAEVDKTANAFITGTTLSFTDSNNAGTTGFNNFQASTKHTAAGGYYTQNQTNFSTTLQLSGSASGIIEARNFLSQLYLKDTTGNYKASKLSSGVFWIYSARDVGTNTHTITDINALDARTAYGWGSSAATWNVTNMTGLDIGTDMSGNGATVNVTDMTGVYIRDPFRNGTTPGTRTNVSGIKIDIPTGGTNKYGVNLNGDGVGADLVLGAGQDAKIYYDGTDMVLDPNVVGTGKVLIGATGNDTINAGAYEVGGVAGLSGTYTFGGGASGDIAQMTFTSGILTAVTTVP